MKPQPSPRTYRLSTDALNALKMLMAKFSEKSAAKMISQSLIRTATSSDTPLVQFRGLDVREILTLQAEISMLERQHIAIKREIMRIRPGDKDCAAKIASVVEKADVELERLRSLRHSLSQQARLADKLTPDAAKKLGTIRKWIQQRLDRSDEQSKPYYNLELSILNSLYPCTNSSGAQASKPPVAPASPSGSNTFPTQTTKNT